MLKKSQIKKIWKASVAGQQEETAASGALSEVLKSLLKTLDSKELKACATASEREAGPCWMLPADDIHFGECRVRPEVICCKVFRWAELSVQNEAVRQLATCPSRESCSGGAKRCCNPFHYGRVVSFDVPSYQLADFPVSLSRGRHAHPTVEGSVSADSAFSEASFSASSSSPLICSKSRSSSACRSYCVHGSESGMEESSTASSSRLGSEDTESPRRTVARDTDSWLMMAYWEGNDRVGRRRSFTNSSVHVLYEGAAMLRESFCIADIKNKRRTAAAEKKRQQIGNGFQMWRTDDFKVYFYNASQQNMYVQSPTLACSELDDSAQLVKTVPAGCVAEIFDWQRALELEHILRSRHQLRFPFDVTAVRVSMLSCWGAGHRRPTIMQCPCWVEMFFGSQD